jgi:hypothetical protein
MARLDHLVPIKSTWRLPIGKKLTDRLITERAKQGWYGTAAKERALSGLPVTATNGFIDRCEGQDGLCGKMQGVKHFKYKYLPKPMFLCPSCLQIERNRAIKQKDQQRAFKRNIEEFV